MTVYDHLGYGACPDPENFVRGGSTLTTVFLLLFFVCLFDERRKDQNTTQY